MKSESEIKDVTVGFHWSCKTDGDVLQPEKSRLIDRNLATIVVDISRHCNIAYLP